MREIQEKQVRVNEMSRKLPPRIVEDYTMSELKGPVKLSELFGDRRDLIVIHNMGKRCPYCTLWADGLNGVIQHLENRAGLALVSPDPPDVQREFADSRGWRFRMISDDSSFTEDLGFKEVKGDGKASYGPGFSTFWRNDDGSIARIASAWFGPGDVYAPIWHIFGILKNSAGGWEPKFSYD
ncbi:MAG: DUF899 family protein [Planctomycetota bacterium]